MGVEESIPNAGILLRERVSARGFASVA
jgi:hypothetical protein